MRTPRHALRPALLALALAAVSCLAAAQLRDDTGTHVVKPGETLWGISRQHLNTPLQWPRIQRDNALRDPDRLQPGQVLQLGKPGVAELTGTAWIQRGAQAQRALAVGSDIQVGDVLVTERDAFLSLRMADGSRVVVPSSSAVRVLSIDRQRTRLALLRGRVESYVEKQNQQHFEVETRTGRVGVRGTHFRVRDEEGASTSEVIDGKVQFDGNAAAGAQRSASLERGQGALLSGSEALAVQALLQPPRYIGTDAGVANAAPMDGAVAYRLQLARDEQFQQIFHEARETAPRFALPASLEPGFYHLRLTAFDARQIEGLPGDHVLFAPANAGLGAPVARLLPDGRVEIRWPVRAGQQHDFELARTPDFAPLLGAEAAVGSGGVTVGPFDVPGRYHWRARALDPAEPSFSGSFDVPAR